MCISVSERLSKISFQKGCLRDLSRNWNGLFFYPSTSKSTRFLYYFCLCKSFKELFLYRAYQVVFLICGCKGTAFFWTTKTFPEKFSILECFLCTSWFRSIIKTATHYYILYRERNNPSAGGSRSCCEGTAILTREDWWEKEKFPQKVLGFKIIKVTLQHETEYINLK